MLHAAAFILSLAATALGAGPASWPCTWSEPPKGTPSSTWPDGPHLGDGNQGLVVGGAPGEVTIYGAVHGFWGVSFGANSSMPPLGSSQPLGFPGCPAQDCSITVGLTLSRLIIGSAQLAGPGSTWNATLDIASGVATVDLASGAAALRITLYQHATEGVGLVTLANVGSATLAGLNVTLAGNGNIRHVPVAVGCGLASAAAACPASPPPALPALSLTKEANPTGVVSPMPIQGAAGLLPLGALPGTPAAQPLAVLDYSATEMAGDWAKGGAKVATLTTGRTQQLALPAGGTLVYAISQAASRDPGVYPSLTPLQAVAQRLQRITLAALPALAASHSAWWAAHYAASSIALDASENSTEAFFYSTLYALGAGTRAGQTVMDLWSPWRTTDYSAWRANPTMDYNQQALYSGVYALNHVELAQPYYDFLAQAVADGGPQLEAAALGCPDGIHLSVDLAPYGLKMGVRGEAQDWGIRSNAVYAAVSYSYHWDVVAHDDAGVLAWARDTALPFLRLVASFWQCALQRVEHIPGAPGGYRYWSVGDCNGDEGCGLPPAMATNPVWTITYLRRMLTTLASMAQALSLPADPAWADMLLHLPPTAVTTVLMPPPHGAPVQVLSMYGEGAVNASATQAHAFASGQQPGYLHSLWPGESLSPLSEPNATLAAAALATYSYVPWSQDNSFSWMFSGAARAGVAPNITQAHWGRALLTNARANRLVAWGGLCSDSLGAVQYVVDMLVQGREGFLRAFPAWPGSANASFATLRLPGALLVSGGYVGVAGAGGVSGEVAGGTAHLGVRAEGRAGGGSAARAVKVLSPWQAAGRGSVRVCAGAAGVCAAGAPFEALSWSTVGGMRGGDALSWVAQADGDSTVFRAAAGGGV